METLQYLPERNVKIHLFTSHRCFSSLKSRHIELFLHFALNQYCETKMQQGENNFNVELSI